MSKGKKGFELESGGIGLLVGIDPGSEVSGIAWLVAGDVPRGANIDNREVFSFIKGLAGIGRVVVVIEDIKAYEGVMRGAVINTAKWCGEIEFRLGRAGFVSRVHLIARNTVKAWVFRQWPQICGERIEGKIARLGPVKNEIGGILVERPRKVSFHYVDDRIVMACMKSFYGIANPLPGKSNGLGLVGHSWQALSVVSWFLQVFAKSDLLALHTTKPKS